MAQLYNPITDAFTYYSPVEVSKSEELTIDDPLFGTIKLPSGYTVGSNGNIRAPNNSIGNSLVELLEFDILKPIVNNNTVINNSKKTYNSNLNKDQKTLAVNIVNSIINKSNGKIKPEQASAIVGHLIAESGLTPSKINNNDLGATSGGLGLWRGERFNELKLFAKKQGKTWNNLDVLVDFLLHELNNNYSDIYNNLISSNNPSDASKVWSYYERFAGYDNNLNSARKLLRSKGWSDAQTLKWILDQHSKRENNSEEIYELWKQSRNS